MSIFNTLTRTSIILSRSINSYIITLWLCTMFYYCAPCYSRIKLLCYCFILYIIFLAKIVTSVLKNWMCEDTVIEWSDIWRRTWSRLHRRPRGRDTLWPSLPAGPGRHGNPVCHYTLETCNQNHIMTSSKWKLRMIGLTVGMCGRPSSGSDVAAELEIPWMCVHRGRLDEWHPEIPHCRLHPLLGNAPSRRRRGRGLGGDKGHRPTP